MMDPSNINHTKNHTFINIRVLVLGKKNVYAIMACSKLNNTRLCKGLYGTVFVILSDHLNRYLIYHGILENLI